MTDQVMIVVGLLVLGYLLVAVEVFVVPGIGVPGIAGTACLVVASVLAVRFFGKTTGGWLVVGVLALSTALAVLLPRTPFGRWVVHRKTLSTARTETRGLPVGEEGVTESVLRPAGIVRFGERRESVVSEGEFIEPGVAVRVVAVEGLRIVVEKLELDAES